MCSLLYRSIGVIFIVKNYWGDQMKDVMGGTYGTHCGYEKFVELNASRTDATSEIQTQKGG
jgi:hypothetical protein